jgi:hypothetical protein
MPLQITISSPGEAALMASWINVNFAAGHTAGLLLTVNLLEGAANEQRAH